MNWLKVLVGLSAIIIAGCAAYFSVTGLGVLFAGASTSVIVMASSLELAKLVAATYLKQKWDVIGGFNKWYLTLSVGVLMLITSAGIFGLRSIDARDKEISKINDKISILQEENAAETEKINEIKVTNLDLEKEVGGFRFVAEAFDIELKNVVKFFIFLIVIVFDPLAVALIIAFNGLISDKKEKEYEVYGDKEKQRELLKEIIQADEKDGLYDDWDVILNDGLEDKPTVNEDIVENPPKEEEELPNLKWEEYMHPEFPWNNRKLWINNPKAVNYWLNTKKGNVRDLARFRTEDENIKIY